MGDPLITQADIENRISPRELVALADDDGDGEADASKITQAIQVASDAGYAALLGAFSSNARVKTLVQNDAAAKNDVVEIAVGWLGTRRPHMMAADGKTPYSSWRSDAEKRLKQLKDAEIRSPGEETAGANSTLATSVNRDPPDFMFVGTRQNPRGKGGF